MGTQLVLWTTKAKWGGTGIGKWLAEGAVGRDERIWLRAHCIFTKHLK